MADVPASLDSVHWISEALERLRVPYAFIGGVALNTWGVPRATFDLDLARARGALSFRRAKGQPACRWTPSLHGGD